MTRQLLTLSALFVLTSSLLIADASAGCGGGRRGYHHPARPVVVRHVRHVRHVSPVVVQPTIVAPRPARQFPTVPAGSVLTLPANFLGHQPGSVLMVFNNVKLPVQIMKWTNNGVTVKLPPMAIRRPVVIRLDIVLPHGKLGLTQRVNVTPPAAIVLHPTAPMSPLPTSPAIQAAAPAIPMGPAIAPAAPGLLPPAGLSVQPAAQAPFVLPTQNAAPNALAAGTPSQPILLPPAGGPSPVALPPQSAPAPQPGSGIQAGTPSQPIVLPMQNAAPNQVQAGTPSQPIVLPMQTAAPAQPSGNPQIGTPNQPIVLPPAAAQPGVTAPLDPTPSVEVDTMENNPILNEHRTTEEAAPAPATNGTAASFFTMIGNVLTQ